MMKKYKSNLDEMQEKKLLEIEHNTYNLALISLIVAIFVQNIFYNGSFENTIGETIVLLIICLYSVFSSIKNGIWDRKFKPNFNTNIKLSLIAALVYGGYEFTITYHNYHSLAGSIAAFVFMVIFAFILTLGTLTVTSKIYKNKKAKLDELADKEENE